MGAETPTGKTGNGWTVKRLQVWPREDEAAVPFFAASWSAAKHSLRLNRFSYKEGALRTIWKVENDFAPHPRSPTPPLVPNSRAYGAATSKCPLEAASVVTTAHRAVRRPKILAP